jgi:hypothetical protein
MRSCRICGCTDDRACPGGCAWVAEDLCSACVEHALLEDNVAGVVSADEACPVATIDAPHQVLWRDQHTGHCVRCREEFRA